MLATIRKHLRLPLCYVGVPLYKFTAWMNRRYPGNVCIEVGHTRLIGPQEVVNRCVGVLDELKLESPEIHRALTIDENLTFSLLPWWNVTMMGSRYSCCGNEYLHWGDDGIRAFLVYTAYCVLERLIHPSVRLDDYYYYKSARKQNAALQKSRWLATHQQPDELVQYFASFGTKR